MTTSELQQAVSTAAAYMKFVCGVGNNAAWLVTLDAYDQAKKHRNWEKRVKGGHTVKSLYKMVMKAHKNYERNLIYTDTNRMFHVADMPPEARKIFGDISDRDYFDYWASVGGGAYAKTRPAITSLWNKYRLSLLHHDIEQSDIMAWIMTATAALCTAQSLYERGLKTCHEEWGLPTEGLRRIFRGLDLANIAKLWMDAMQATDPASDSYELEPTENRNIEFGLLQLTESWFSLRTLYESVQATTEDYSEVFRTAGEQKKALCQIAKLRAETYKNAELLKV